MSQFNLTTLPVKASGSPRILLCTCHHDTTVSVAGKDQK